MGRFGARVTWPLWAPWLALKLVACGSPAPPAAPCPAPCRRTDTPVAGLRVTLSDNATNVCVAEGGCLGEPKGSVRTTSLQPPVRRAVAEALAAAGFELVSADAERDIVAGVEWQGTDTLALGLRDKRGRLIDQASYRRSLEPCRALPELTWDTCWAANFERMKQALATPLSSSPALVAFARKAKGLGSDETSAPVAVTARDTPTESSPATLNERLSDQQLQETVARYREQVQRSCWLPALDAREPTAPTSARVSTSITISASGSVLDVKTGGDPLGYLRLSDCIAGQVRGWRFPAAQNPTTTSIPFVFAGE